MVPHMRTDNLLLTCIFLGGLWPGIGAAELSAEQALGKRLFFDASLSTPPGQGCFSCHAPSAGFSEPNQELPVSRGVHPDRFGNRNTPSAAYAAFSPEFHFDEQEGLYVGGQFWDGRAATLEEQAKGPFLNPLEMANPDPAAVVKKVKATDYASTFEQVYGPGALDEVEQAYEYIARAIAAFERSPELNPFSSKYDAYLRGDAELSPREKRGLALFQAEDKGNCAACHPVTPGEDGSPPLFTDFTYDNLGVPRNPDNPFYKLPREFNPEGAEFVDPGLGKTTKDPAQNGKHKVSGLRNIALTAPYMHNGSMRTLKEVVEFYNVRDLVPRWSPPEVAENMNREELGNLGLTDREVDDIVAFMLTLSDGYQEKRAGQE